MKKIDNKLLYAAGGLIVGAAAVWIFGNTPIGSTGTPVMSGNLNRQSDQRSVQMDAHFIEQMIPHHEDAITMSKIALVKAQRSEVKTLAQNIIDSQSKEIEQMKEWYKEWFGKDLPDGSDVMNQHGMMGNSGMHMGVRGDSTDMQSLENSEDFDTEFVEQMIPHHQMAVMMASMLKNGTSRPEMKKLAEDIITTQSEEIDLMRGWLREWDQ